MKCWVSLHLVITSFRARNASHIQLIQHEAWCRSWNPETAIEEQFCLWFCYRVPDLDDWQRLGWVCPGRLVSPWSIGVNWRWATDPRTSRRPGPDYNACSTDRLSARGLQTAFAAQVLPESPPTITHVFLSSTSNTILSEEKAWIRDRSHDGGSVQAHERNVRDGFGIGHACTVEGLDTASNCPVKGMRSTSGRNPYRILYPEPDLPASHPELDWGQQEDISLTRLWSWRELFGRWSYRSLGYRPGGGFAPTSGQLS